MRKLLLTARIASSALAFSIAFSVELHGTASATPIFVDTFDSGASPAWGNERGAWRAEDGTYDASLPNNDPLTYTSVTTFPDLIDFVIDVDVNDTDDGGIWLRSSFENGLITGILLVLASSEVYWHEVTVDNNDQSTFLPVLNPAFVPGLEGSDVHLQVNVIGNSFSVFLNGDPNPLTTLISDLYASGSVGLYDNSPSIGDPGRGQTFDNFKITEVAEPGSLVLLVSGLFGLILSNRQRRVAAEGADCSATRP
jgi:hypothetical protein